MSFSLAVLIPLFLVLFFNLPFYKISGKIAVFIASLFCIVQAFSFFIPADASCPAIQSLVSYFMLDFQCDGISRLMLLTSAIVAFSAILVLYATEESDRKQFNFINLILLSLAGMNGLFFVRDVFSIYVFIEVISATSCILIAINKDKNSLEASFKYLIMSSVATVMMLASVAILFLVAGGTDFVTVSNMYQQYGGNILVMSAVVLFIAGLFIKGGIMPFHGWLPDTYSAGSAPVSVYIPGIVTKTLGIYTLIRLFYSVFGFNTAIQSILLIFASISIVFGAFAAINQNNFKRMLAYSSISQVGYIVLGFGAGTTFGVAAAIFHLFNHSVFKSLLFVNSAALEKQVNISDMSEMGGLASKMPVTSTTSVIAFLSTAGIPPLSGFWSKLMIILALWTADLKVYAVIAILASILTMTYFLIMQKKVFFGRLKEGFENVKEAPLAITFVSILLCAITVVVGLLFPFVLNGLINSAVSF